MRGRLFQPFVTGKEDGVGLGLSICKRLVEAHGGHINAADAPGGGTVVRFTLPPGENPKSEIRNPKQIQMAKTQ